MLFQMADALEVGVQPVPFAGVRAPRPLIRVLMRDQATEVVLRQATDAIVVLQVEPSLVPILEGTPEPGPGV